MKISNARFGGSNKLPDILNKISQQIFNDKSFFKSKIFSDWSYIVGDEIAAICHPQKMLTYNMGKIADNILVLEVDSAAFATSLNYMVPLIIERISIYLGYQAINKIKLVIAPKTPKNLILKVEYKNLYSKNDFNLENDEINQALMNLGNLI